MKNRILILNEAYIPAKKAGGPVVSILNLVNFLSKEFDVYIITLDHDLDDNERFPDIKTGINIVGDSKVIYLAKDQINYKNLKSIIQDINPQLIYLNSFFDYKFVIPILRISKKISCKILLAARGELYKDALSIKKYKKIPYIFIINRMKYLKNIYFHATSNAEKIQYCKYFKCDESKIALLNNIPTKCEFKNPHKKVKDQNKLNIVYLSRIQVDKNLYTAIKIVNQLDGDIQFDIYGNIENINYWNKCKKLIEESPTNINISYKNQAPHEEVHQILASYHVMLLPSRSENYGHVIAESILAQTPVIISDQTPWSNVNDYNAGKAIPVDNISVFVDTLNKFTAMDQAEYDVISDNVERYKNENIFEEKIGNSYIVEFKKIIKS